MLMRKAIVAPYKKEGTRDRGWAVRPVFTPRPTFSLRWGKKVPIMGHEYHIFRLFAVAGGKANRA
jgi:hypothetical protein